MKIFKFIAGAAAALTLTGGAAFAAPSAWQGDAPMHNANWMMVSGDKEALIMYENDGIERHGSEARMWVALLFSQPQGSGDKAYSILLARNSFDCSAKTWKPITMIALNASGSVVDTKDLTGSQAQAAEGGSATIMDKACAGSVSSGSDKLDDIVIAHAAYLQLVADGKIK